RPTGCGARRPLGLPIRGPPFLLHTGPAALPVGDGVLAARLRVGRLPGLRRPHRRRQRRRVLLRRDRPDGPPPRAPDAAGDLPPLPGPAGAGRLRTAGAPRSVWEFIGRI